MLMLDRPQVFAAPSSWRAQPTLRERLFAKIEKQATPLGCWRWTGAQVGRKRKVGKGYGGIAVDGVSRRAHRVMYELEVGPIPEGMQCHHICGNATCINPAHIELVTAGEHGQLHSHDGEERRSFKPCPQGHPYDEENFRVGSRGYRICRICQREQSRRAYARKHPDVDIRPYRRRKT